MQTSREAEAACRAALNISPTSHRLLRLRGDSLYELGDFTEAARVFAEAVRLEPRDTDGHAGLAASLCAMHDFAGCVAAYRQLLALIPDYAEGYVELACAQINLADMRAAISSLQIAFRLDLSLINVVLKRECFRPIQSEPAFLRLLQTG